MEKKRIRKWFWVWDFEKEECWLNEMARCGWLLDDVGFCRYDFVPCEPGRHTVRMEMHRRDEAYLEFMKETGAQYIGRMVQWVYFCKDVKDGPFDIFSDIDSKIAHLDRIGKMLAAIGGGNLLIGISNSLNPIMNIGWINLLCATLLMYGLGRIHGSKEALKKERLLRE
jgi:hypothetical protein